MLSACFLFCLQAAAPFAPPEKPLPDPASFVREIRKKLRSDRLLLSQYTYMEKVTALELDKQGKVKKTNARLFEVYPSLEEGQTYRKLISKDGKPIPASDQEKQDREHAKKLMERQHKLEREGVSEKARRAAKEAEERRKEDEILDDVFRLYTVELIGRKVTDGQPTIEVAFEPRPGYKGKTREARMMGKIRGRAWFGEDDHEIVAIDAQLVDDISLGLGLLAKLNKGAHMVFKRRRVNDEIWLPAESRFTGTGRLLLFKGLRLDVSQEYSDYRKFSVETSVKYSLDKNP